MGNILFTIFIHPLIILFTTILEISSQYCSKSTSILILSITVQLLSVPLYKIASKVEKKEKELQKMITPELNVLKTLYSGEELFYRTDALYKKLHYNPLLGFRSSMSLFLVIPFFIAAYQVLNANPIFDHETFLGLFTLSQPDALLGGINILPFLMTLFNFIAIKYANPKKPLFDPSNYMLLILSIFFLVYLYNSSSALLLYWTMNNFIYMNKLILSTKNRA